MGRRGPARTPAHVLRARGSNITKYSSQSPDGDTRENEARAPDGTPRMPPGMPDQAKAVWKRTLPILREIGILSHADQYAIQQFSLQASMLYDLQKQYQRAGEIDERLVKLINQTRAQAMTLAGKLGLTAADRTRINIEKPPEEPPAPVRPKRQRIAGPTLVEANG